MWGCALSGISLHPPRTHPLSPPLPSRNARLRGGPVNREFSFATKTEVTNLSSNTSQLEGRVKTMEKEIAELKALLLAKASA